MATKTSQQIAKYYETYQNIDVTFNNQVINLTGLLTKLISFKIGNNQVPCVIYSSSMLEAKIVANLNSELFEKIRETHNLVSLNFAFKRQGKTTPLKFFIPAKIIGVNPYNVAKPELNFLTISFLQKPPDDLIEILGGLLSLKTKTQQRAEERIELNEENKRKLKLTTKDIIILVDNIPRKCILRDLSFSGAKVILVGVGKFLLKKPIIMKLHFDNTLQPLELKGVILRCEEVTGRKDLVALGIQFDANDIPIEYTKYLTEYFS